jgi:PEGA domain
MLNARRFPSGWADRRLAPEGAPGPGRAWHTEEACCGRRRTMKRNLFLAAGLLLAVFSAGCVDQRYLITSDPPGATVLRNGVPIGYTPVDDHFVYYGNYHFTLIKDGYETLQVDQEIPAPWYEYPPLDFVSEAIVPFHLHDVHTFHYQMCEAQPVGKDEVLPRAQQLRERGQSLVGQNPQPAPAPIVPSGPSLGAPLPQGPGAP